MAVTEAGAAREVTVKIIPEVSGDLAALLGASTDDTIEKVNAGAALVYALYHAPADWWLGKGDYEGHGPPGAVLNAYTRACEAYRVGRKAGN